MASSEAEPFLKNAERVSNGGPSPQRSLELRTNLENLAGRETLLGGISSAVYFSPGPSA
eukprot:CAMPEP_0204028346 /NCGR_PEP_ID=MMETSP0360-20130528/52628_1 /ASSEMBLY_ACC=CAM_ASM_000342 /TAXON_ID=268821 /ORGANISM="Scrippsiella Hangoei, Strain SHTV-5" /LENGTH=58 /DNA_ID=CAMNT_0050972163 /DNA_START=108 /DNA_END=284 /DNA_ORIENTATION=-